MKQISYISLILLFNVKISLASETWLYQINKKDKKTFLLNPNCQERILNPHLGGDIIRSTCLTQKMATLAERNENWLKLDSPLYPNDPLLSDQWYLDSIQLPLYWQTHGTGNKDLKIAVIDSGVNYLHEDLAQHLSRNQGEIPENQIDDDQNGYVDDYLGWDAYAQNGNPLAKFDHGTHVIGIIGANTNNQIGMAGINWQSEIIPIKFVDERGGGSTESAIVAIDYAVARGAKIINASWSGKKQSPLLAEVISRLKSKNILFVAAAGNEANDNDVSPTYPASFEDEHIIAVASHDLSGQLSSFSNYGKKSVDISAPGESILSSIATERYGFNSGTSMAAPMITGIASLIWSEHPEWNALQIKNAILDQCIHAQNLPLVCGGRLQLKN